MRLHRESARRLAASMPMIQNMTPANDVGR